MSEPERRIDLTDGQWVEIEDFGPWSNRRFDEFRELVRKLSSGATAPEDEERFIRIGVRAWHLVDPDTGQTLNDPKTDDLKGLTVTTTKSTVERLAEVVFAATTPFPQLRRPSST